MTQQLQRIPQAPAVRRVPTVTAPTDQRMATAQRQFMLNLERQAAKERRDAQQYATWCADRAPDGRVTRSVSREKRILIGATLAVTAVLAVVAVMIIHLLMTTLGVGLLAAVGIAALLPTGGSCYTIIIIHGH